MALTLDDRPGALAEVMERLAKSGRNIKYCYGSAAPGCDRATVCFVVDDPVNADLLFASKD